MSEKFKWRLNSKIIRGGVVEIIKKHKMSARLCNG